MIKFIYKIIPIPVIFTNLFIGDFAGRSYGFFILMRKDEKENNALLQHELTHCKQFYRTLGLHLILYSVWDKYRLNCEIEAYKKTIEYAGYTDQSQSEWIVKSLHKDYDLNITKPEIRKLLHNI